VVNEELIKKGDDPIHFDHDCREGICGACSLVIDGVPHGKEAATTTCQLHMRHYHDGDTIFIEPFRAKAFPVLKDLVVDRTAFDRIIAAGGFISVRTGSAAEANSILVPKTEADLSMEAAACIGCGACVASCPNASAALFTSAKVSHLGYLPQGQPERRIRAIAMADQARIEGFGHCTSIGECEAVCPAHIPLEVISRMNRDFVRATLGRRATDEIPPPATQPASALSRFAEAAKAKA